MEDNTINAVSGETSATPIQVPDQSEITFVKKADSNLKSIHMSGDHFIIKEEAPIRSYETFRFNDSNVDLPGVFFQGTQYYDLKNVYFINNTGMAKLIDLLKSLLEKNMDVRFVNVSEKIKSKIQSLGLDHIIICS